MDKRKQFEFALSFSPVLFTPVSFNPYAMIDCIKMFTPLMILPPLMAVSPAPEMGGLVV